MAKNTGKAPRGSALLLVLLFMTAMLVLCIPLLLAAHTSVQRGAVHRAVSAQYYAAESAVQVAAQDFFEKIGAETAAFAHLAPQDLPDAESPFFYVSESAGGDHAKEAGKAAQLEALLPAKTLTVGDGAEVELLGVAFNGLTFAQVQDGGVPQTVKHGAKTYYIYCLESVEPVISARAGGTRVTMTYGYKPGVIVTVRKGPGGGDGNGGGAAFGGATGGIYGDTPQEELYQQIVAALEALMQDAADDYQNYDTTAEITGGDPDFPIASNVTNVAPDAKYVHSWGGVTLGTPGAVTVYPHLRYIESDLLTIQGEVYCPNLVAGLVNGVTLEADSTFVCPELAHMNAQGSAISIGANARINPMVADAAGEVANPLAVPVPPGYPPDTYRREGAVFYNTGAGLSVAVGPHTEINWCTFKVSSVDIHYQHGGKLTSNSVFISFGNVQLSGGPASTDTRRVVPQFYSGDTWHNFSTGVGTVAGVYITLDEEPLFAGTLPEDVNFVGTVVGNLMGWAPAYVDNEIHPFDARDVSLMMDSAIWDTIRSGGGGSGGSGGEGPDEVDVTFTPGIVKEPVIYDSTGEASE